MTQQDDITQRVLTDDEIRDIITGTHQAFGEFKSGYMLVLGRAIESALLSKLRAEGVQAGDERVSLRGAANLAFNALHECKPAKGAEKQYSDAIKALQSALHDIAYTVNRTATPQQFADHLQREARAALASAPVAVEQHDGLRTLLAELPGMHEDPKKGDAVFRCGVNGALNVVERRIRELLRSAPVAGEAIGYVDSLYLACRQRGLPCFGTIHHTPTSDATAPVYAAPQASAEDVRNAALDQAAAVAKRISDKYAFGHYGNETDTADEIEREILALKQPQADKDGCTCPSGDGSLRHPCPMHPGADKDGGQQRAGDVDVDRLMAAAKGMTRLYSYVWDRTDGCLVVFPENVRAFDEAFDALRMATGEAVDDAPQAEQGERDAK